MGVGEEGVALWQHLCCVHTGGMNHDCPMMEFGSEEIQNMPPQTTPLWHIDHSELKALEKEQMQEELSALPNPTSKQVIKFPMRKVPSLYQGEKHILISRAWKSMAK